ncbi:hypothetical protein [Nonomuraea terrae]|uniref:hypothetical protein n=1 Tax=Nonomuraea terrae TaxID=2530383 RepID=UPI00140516B3|nr:hypothetical protein [Nonomuraea terrae]
MTAAVVLTALDPLDNDRYPVVRPTRVAEDARGVSCLPVGSSPLGDRAAPPSVLVESG